LTDPALIRNWPKKWLNDPEIAPALRYLDRYLHDFQRTTTTTTNTITNEITNVTEITNVSQGAVNVGRLYGETAVAPEKPVVFNQITPVKYLTCEVISSSRYEATDNMFLRITRDCVLTLPENPCKDCQINFTKGASILTLKGNGRKIQGSRNDIVFRKNNLARQIYYFIETDEWFFL